MKTKPIKLPRLARLRNLPQAMQDRHEAARFRRFKLEPIYRNRWKIGQCPNSYATTAEQAQAKGHFLLAARMWEYAACVSLGHNRAERYRQAMERCLEAAHTKLILPATRPSAH